MTGSISLVEQLDVHWAAHLGCTPEQLRDGGRHVVVRPSNADGTAPPWPLRRGPVALFTTGSGWVLSVPEGMIQRATLLCTPLAFEEIVAEGDRLSQQWWDGGDHHNPTMKREEGDAGYRVMNEVVEGISLRGWSHYILSYGDPLALQDQFDPNVRKITPEEPDIWAQFCKWPGSMCGLHICGYFPISTPFGYVLDGNLVSVAQIEAQPEDLEWEYGVDTLSEYCGKGFATAVLRTVTAYIVRQGHIPWHYTDHYNRPSRRLPEKIGYSKYGEGLFSAV